MPVTDSIPHRPPFLFVDEIVSEGADGLVARRDLADNVPMRVTAIGAADV